eukprot:750035-Hanusia_phi.AAC.1
MRRSPGSPPAPLYASASPPAKHFHHLLDQCGSPGPASVRLSFELQDRDQLPKRASTSLANSPSSETRNLSPSTELKYQSSKSSSRGLIGSPALYRSSIESSPNTTISSTKSWHNSPAAAFRSPVSDETIGSTGLILRKSADGIVLVAHLAVGGPADLCGRISLHDRLLSVDGHFLTSELSHEQIAELLMGPIGSIVHLSLLRTESGSEYSVNLVRARSFVARGRSPQINARMRRERLADEIYREICGRKRRSTTKIVLQTWKEFAKSQVLLSNIGLNLMSKVLANLLSRMFGTWRCFIVFEQERSVHVMKLHFQSSSGPSVTHFSRKCMKLKQFKKLTSKDDETQNANVLEAIRDAASINQNLEQNLRLECLNSQILGSQLAVIQQECRDAIHDLDDLHKSIEEDQRHQASVASQFSRQIQNILEVKNDIICQYEAAREMLLEKDATLDTTKNKMRQIENLMDEWASENVLQRKVYDFVYADKLDEFVCLGVRSSTGGEQCSSRSSFKVWKYHRIFEMLMEEELQRQLRLRETLIMDVRPRTAQEAGVGLLLVKESAQNQEIVKVVKITPGGAAARDGRIKVGDSITAIDGTSLFRLSMEEICSRIRGPEGEPISLSVERNQLDLQVSMEVCLHRLAVPMEHKRLAAAAPEQRMDEQAGQRNKEGGRATSDPGQLNLVEALKENTFFSAINNALKSINQPQLAEDDIIMM